MVIVILEDGAKYKVDTENETAAKNDIIHKLRDHMDFRKVERTELLPEKMVETDLCYNQIGGPSYNLKCVNGKPFVWNEESDVAFDKFLIENSNIL